MATWDAGRPVGAEQWNYAGGKIRDNMAFLEQALQILSTFAINPSDSSVNNYNKVGFGPFSSRPALGVAQQTGVMYFATDTGGWYICTVGTTNTWVEITSFGAGLTIGAGTKVIGPAGESWLQQSGIDMDPHAHAARHRPGSVDGVWDASVDFLPYSLQRILETTTVLNVFILNATFPAQDFVTYAHFSQDISTVGRPTTSRMRVVGELTFSFKDGLNSDEQLEMGLFLDNPATQLGNTVWWSGPQASTTSFRVGNKITIPIERYITGVSAGAHTIAMLSRSSSYEFDVEEGLLRIEDLGTE